MVVMAMSRNQNLPEENNEQEPLSQEERVIQQEINIVKSLACNDLQKRNRQLKRLRKYLELRIGSSFPLKEENFRRIWKGLYTTMWMSDKPLVQEELADQLGKLLLCFGVNLEASTDFFGAFLYIMRLHWFGIDQWRIDKFMMLVRRMLRYMLGVLKNAGWPIDGIKLFNKHLTETVLAEKVSSAGLTLHVLDIFCDELAKVSNGEITAKQVGNFLKPFIIFYCTQSDCKLTSHCRTHIIYHMLYQSKLGREYTEKYNAWKEMGFPTASINDLEKSEGDNGEVEEPAYDENGQNDTPRHLDPRAGNVDVFVPELPLDVKYIINILESYIHKDGINTKRRKLFKKLLDACKTYQNGEFPLGIKRMPHLNLQPKEEIIADKIENLDEVYDELYGVGRTLKQLNKRKRRKLLKTLNFEHADENNFDAVIKQALPKDILRGIKRKAALDKLMNSWIEEDIDADLVPKKKQKTEETNETSKNKLTEDADADLVPNKKRETNGSSNKKLTEKVNADLVPQKKHKTVETNEALKNEIKILQKKSKGGKAEIKNEETQTDVKSNKNNEKPAISKSDVSPVASAKSDLKKTATAEWNRPLKEGEIEYFIPSRKLQLKRANSDLVPNPLAMKKKMTSVSATNSPKTPASAKRVKIALKRNTVQNPSEYIRQVKRSPDVPYDATRKPGKGLLKPNCMPSPINPFYKKKFGLSLLNDTM